MAIPQVLKVVGTFAAWTVGAYLGAILFQILAKGMPVTAALIASAEVFPEAFIGTAVLTILMVVRSQWRASKARRASLRRGTSRSLGAQ
ncbi:hypothetical protein ABT294_10725 [Nonomuraea sp. NPDC000554]|uniref:hypothetical protein n=1 Tax=Nonomuraea sp. NPDC000554 TaxID=3154259 RepID=UPI003322661B